MAPVTYPRRLHDLALEEPAGLGREVVELVLQDRDHMPGNVLEQLRVLGLRFSIHDFGTGHSSLAHRCAGVRG